jgi:hypothetical protein
MAEIGLKKMRDFALIIFADTWHGKYLLLDEALSINRADSISLMTALTRTGLKDTRKRQSN